MQLNRTIVNPKTLELGLEFNKSVDNLILPINLRGVLNKCEYLLKDISMKDLEEYAKSERLIYIDYIPRVNYTGADKVTSKMLWHINLIMISVIVNFYNTQNILNHFNMNVATLTIEDVLFNLNYWASKLHKNYQPFIDDYFSTIHCKKFDYIHSMISHYERVYKDLNEINTGIDNYSPDVSFAISANNLFNRIDDNGNIIKRKLCVWAYGEPSNYTYVGVRTWDGNFCLYLPVEIKTRLHQWFYIDSKSCRKYIRELTKDVIVNKTKYDAKGNSASIDNLFRAMHKYNKENNSSIINEREIEILKEDLKDYFNKFKNMVGNQEEAMKEALFKTEQSPVITDSAPVITESAPVITNEEPVEVSVEEETTIQNEPEEEGEDSKLSNDDFFKKLLNETY